MRNLASLVSTVAEYVPHIYKAVTSAIATGSAMYLTFRQIGAPTLTPEEWIALALSAMGSGLSVWLTRNRPA